MILQISDIKTKKSASPNGGWVAWIDFSFFQAWAKTEGEAIDVLQKELHLKIDVPGRKA